MAPFGRSTSTIIGGFFLVLMVAFLLFSLGAYHGDLTWRLILCALVFMGVALFFFAGPGTGSSSQQQSVVLGDGQVIRQAQGFLGICTKCGTRFQEAFPFCPQCGQPQG
ncbi:MAG: hypothetical protein ACYDBQ_05760 [Thermoplasmatota archaeon]